MGTRSRRALLVAMSGVRVKNEELARMGLTLPGFVERSQIIASLPSLSLLTLAAHTPPAWELEYREIDEVTLADHAAIAAGRFDLVAISSLAARIGDAYALADRLRAGGVKVAIGGLHASALPAEALQHADAVVEGEGEVVWPALLADLEAGRLRPRYRARGGDWPAFRLEDAKVPRYDLLDPARYDRIPLQTTRGCHLACTFCAASRLISAPKRKPVPLVRREIEAILEIWPRPFIELADDNTFASKAWARDLARLFAEHNARRNQKIAWFTETDLSVADDPELLRLLAEADCAELLIGLESADPAALRRAEPRGWKAGERARYADKVGAIQDAGIPVNGCFVLGFDEDDASVFERTLELARECDLSEVQITVLTPFPGTALHRQLEAEGRLLRPVFWDECTLFDVTFRPARMSVEELERGFRWLMREVYSPAEAARRRARFRRATRIRRGHDDPH